MYYNGLHNTGCQNSSDSLDHHTAVINKRTTSINFLICNIVYECDMRICLSSSKHFVLSNLSLFSGGLFCSFSRSKKDVLNTTQSSNCKVWKGKKGNTILRLPWERTHSKLCSGPPLDMSGWSPQFRLITSPWPRGAPQVGLVGPRTVLKQVLKMRDF